MEGLKEWLAEQNKLVHAIYSDIRTPGDAELAIERAVRHALEPEMTITQRMKNARETLEAQGLDPVHELGLVAKSLPKDSSARIGVLQHLTEFTHPKLQRTEMTGKDGERLELTDTERAARIASILDAARARGTGQSPKAKKVGTTRRPAKGSVRKPR